jgi:hypothetical protein
VELWFVSFDWGNATETNITVSPEISYGGGEFYGFTASSVPNGNMTLRVNQPTEITVTLSVPKGRKNGVGLGYNYGASLVDIKSEYGVLDSSNNLYNPEPTLRAQPANVTDENSVTVEVFNPGPWSIDYGSDFKVEKMINGSWTAVVTPGVYAGYSMTMGAGSEWKQDIDITGLNSGVYRVVKEVESEWLNGMETLFAEFTVRRSLELSDRQTLVELALNDEVNVLLQGIQTGAVKVPEGGLILLSTLNLSGVEVPNTVHGVTIRSMTQDEIDALSRVNHVNYMFFDKIIDTGPNMAEVTLTFIWNYKVGTFDANIIGDSGITYYCSKQSGIWVITSGFGWVP